MVPLSLWIVYLSQFFGICGLTSIRMFLPAFLYFLALRISAVYPQYFPELMVRTGTQVPAWQLSDAFLIVSGCLALAELMAVRCPEIKQFLAEYLEKITKPVLAILLLSGILSAQQGAETEQLLQSSCQLKTACIFSFPVMCGLLGGGVTYLLCCARVRLLDILCRMDPDGSLGLQKFINFLEELLSLGVVLMMIFLPLAALLMVLGMMLAGWLIRQSIAALEKQHSHNCAECGKAGKTTRVSDSAVNCPVCHAPQPEVCKVGFLGLPGRRKLSPEKLAGHTFALLKVRRCRSCASILKLGDVCQVCGTRQWTPEVFADFNSRMRKREFCFLALTILSLIYPAVALVIFIFLFNLMLIRPYRLYLRGTQGLFVRFWFALLQLVLLIPMIILAFVPVIGILSLLPFVLRYLYVKRLFRRNIVFEPVPAKI